MSMREVFGDQIDKENFGKTLSGALVLVGPQKEAGALAIKFHDHLTEALERIANPIEFMQREAKKNGDELNGRAAILLSNDAQYLKDIAKNALTGLIEASNKS